MKSINAELHLNNVECLTNILEMVKQADRHVSTYDEWTKKYAHIVSNNYLRDGLEDVKKWRYISARLQRYYFKKLAQITSEAYNSLPREIEAPHLSVNAF